MATLRRRCRSSRPATGRRCHPNYGVGTTETKAGLVAAASNGEPELTLYIIRVYQRHRGTWLQARPRARRVHTNVSLAPNCRILAVRAGAPRPRIVDDGALVVFGLLGDLTAQNVLLLVENALVGFRDVAFVEARHIALFLTN